MTHAEQIIQLVVVIGLSRKLTRTEKEKLADLIGYYFHGKKGPVPEKKKYLPRFGESDFRTPSAYKALAERILASTGIHECSLPAPQWAEGYPKDRIRSETVQERKKERATVYFDADLDTPSTHIFIDLADGITTESALKSVMRDIRDGKKLALLAPGSFEKYGKPAMDKEIATGMTALWNKHTEKNRTE